LPLSFLFFFFCSAGIWTLISDTGNLPPPTFFLNKSHWKLTHFIFWKNQLLVSIIFSFSVSLIPLTFIISFLLLTSIQLNFLFFHSKETVRHWFETILF
jgi:hypothetical protein